MIMKFLRPCFSPDDVGSVQQPEAGKTVSDEQPDNQEKGKKELLREGMAEKPESVWTSYARRFRKHTLGKVGLVILIFLYLLSLFADPVSPYTMLWNDKTKPYHHPSSPQLTAETRDGNGRTLRPFVYEEIITNQALRTYEPIPLHSLRAIGIEDRVRVSEMRIYAISDSAQRRENELVSGIVRHYRIKTDDPLVNEIRQAIRTVEGSDDPNARLEVDLGAVTINSVETPVRFILARGNKNFLQFFFRGVPYTFLGLFKTDIHLFGSPTGGYFPLGTDKSGRDMLSRLLHGSRVSLTVGIFGSLITIVLGLLIGGLAGYFGGLVDNLLMRLTEVVIAIPSLYLLFALRAALPTDLTSIQVYMIIVAILSLIGWSTTARVIRGQVLAIKTEDFVLSARTMGLSKIKILIRHVLPNTMSYVIINVTLSIPGYILGESALSLLGLGITEPQSSWGLMLAVGRNFRVVRDFPWILIPGFMIFLSILAWNFFGDGVRDALDPKSKH